MVLRIRPTPTRFPTNSLYTPVDNTPLHSISSVCHPCHLINIFLLNTLQLTMEHIAEPDILILPYETTSRRSIHKGIYETNCFKGKPLESAGPRVTERKRRGRPAWVRSWENTPPVEPAQETNADYEILLAQMQAFGLPTNYGIFSPTYKFCFVCLNSFP